MDSKSVIVVLGSVSADTIAYIQSLHTDCLILTGDQAIERGIELVEEHAIKPVDHLPELKEIKMLKVPLTPRSERRGHKKRHSHQNQFNQPNPKGHGRKNFMHRRR